MGDLTSVLGSSIPLPPPQACIIDQRLYGRGFTVSGNGTAAYMRDIVIINSGIKPVAGRRRRRLASDDVSQPRRSLRQTGPTEAPPGVSSANNATTGNNATAATTVVEPEAETAATAPQLRGGGAFFVSGGARLYLQDVYVAGCFAPNGGAIAIVGDKSRLSITGGVISQNAADYNGGAPTPENCELFCMAALPKMRASIAIVVQVITRDSV